MAVTTMPFSSERGDRCQRSLGQVSLWDGTQILFWLARCRWCSRDLQSIVQASENCWSLERCVWLRFSWSGWSCDTTHTLFLGGTQSWWSISSGGKHGTLNICISHHNWTRNGAKEGNTKEQWDNKSKSLFQWEISPGGNPLPLLLFFFLTVYITKPVSFSACFPLLAEMEITPGQDYFWFSLCSSVFSIWAAVGRGVTTRKIPSGMESHDRSLRAEGNRMHMNI